MFNAFPQTLPNGAPTHRLRHLASILHAFGPRVLEDVLKRLIFSPTLDALEIVEALEHHAESTVTPDIVKALGGYDLQSPFFDMIWVIETDRRLGRVPRPRQLVRRPADPAPLRLVPRGEP